MDAARSEHTETKAPTKPGDGSDKDGKGAKDEMDERGGKDGGKDGGAGGPSEDVRTDTRAETGPGAPHDAPHDASRPAARKRPRVHDAHRFASRTLGRVMSDPLWRLRDELVEELGRVGDLATHLADSNAQLRRDEESAISECVALRRELERYRATHALTITAVSTAEPGADSGESGAATGAGDAAPGRRVVLSLVDAEQSARLKLELGDMHRQRDEARQELAAEVARGRAALQRENDRYAATQGETLAMIDRHHAERRALLVQTDALQSQVARLTYLLNDARTKVLVLRKTIHPPPHAPLHFGPTRPPLAFRDSQSWRAADTWPAPEPPAARTRDASADWISTTLFEGTPHDPNEGARRSLGRLPSPRAARPRQRLDYSC